MFQSFAAMTDEQTEQYLLSAGKAGLFAWLEFNDPNGEYEIDGALTVAELRAIALEQLTNSK